MPHLQDFGKRSRITRFRRTVPAKVHDVYCPQMRYPAIVRLLLAVLFAGALLQFAQSSREATLTVRILDAATGLPTPVRVRLQNQNGERPKVHGAVAVSESAIPIPRQAIAVMFGTQDRAEGYAIQPDGSFYVDGSFDVRLPPGTYTLAISKGFEYLRETPSIELKPGDVRNARVQPAPLDRYARARLVFGRRSHSPPPLASPTITPSPQWIAAEDLHVGNLLRMGDFWETYFAQYAFGERGRYTEARTPAFPRTGGAAHSGNRPHHFPGRERLCAQPAGLLFLRQALRPRARAGRCHRNRAPGDVFPRLSRHGAGHAPRQDRFPRTRAILRARGPARRRSTTTSFWTWASS